MSQIQESYSNSSAIGYLHCSVTTKEEEEEEEDPLHTNHGSDPVLDAPHDADHLKTNKKIYVFMVIMFLGNMGSSIVIPSIWFFLNQTSHHPPVHTFWLGITISCFALGQTISLPLWRYCNLKRSLKEVLLFSLLVLIGGDLFFAFTNKFWLIPLARFISGVGTGSTALVQNNISLLATPQNRVRMMGQLTLLAYVSMTVGPLLGSVVSTFRPQHTYFLNWTGFVSASFAFLNILIVSIFLSFGDKTTQSTETSPFASYVDQFHRQIKPIFIAGIGLTFIHFTIFNGAAVYEVSTPILARELFLNTTLADYYLTFFDLLWAACGFISTSSFLLLTLVLIHHLKETTLLFIFLSIIFISFITSTALSFYNTRVFLIVQTCFGISFLAFGFPGAMITNVVLYSKVLGSAPQGLSFTMFSATTIIARVAGPLWASFLCNDDFDRQILFSVSTGMILFSVVVLVMILPIVNRLTWIPEGKRPFL